MAQKGYKVYYLCPPETTLTAPLVKTEIQKNLYVVQHRLNFPYKLRFHARPVFNWFIRKHIRKLEAFLGLTPDILWCFDPNIYANLRWFGAKYTLYHPVDPVIYPDQIKAAATADMIFSVSEQILAPLQQLSVPKYYINHGLGEAFALEAKKQPKLNPQTEPVKLGYVGNLLRQPVDQQLFIRLVQELPHVEFHFWGPHLPNENNLGSEANDKTRTFIQTLSHAKNVIMHGPKSPEELAVEIQQVDAFLLYYAIIPGLSDRSNSHKILEYLSTGKTILSCEIGTYKKLPNLLSMAKEEEDFVEFVKRGIAQLPELNAAELQQERIGYALQHTYPNQLEKILELAGIQPTQNLKAESNDHL